LERVHIGGVMDIYERFGRLVEDYQNELAEHVKTVGVLRALKAGEISLEQIEINGDSWSLTVKPDAEKT
jgi:hypothetical protein